MCQIFANIQQWTEKRREINGRFAIEPKVAGGLHRNIALCMFRDGTIWVNRGVDDAPPTTAVRHYFVLELSSRRLTGFMFYIDFARETGAALSDSIIAAFRDEASLFADAIADFEGVLTLMETAVSCLCNQLPRAEVLQQIGDDSTADRRPPLVQAPSRVPEGFEELVAASNSYRDRKVAGSPAA